MLLTEQIADANFNRMNMKRYFQKLSPEEKEAFAKRVDTSVAYLHQIASGHRKPGLCIALRIQQATQRMVTVEELAGCEQDIKEETAA